MKNSTKPAVMTTAAVTASPALSTYPLDTTAFSNETASKVAEARKGKIPLAVPEEAETNPVSTPREERTSFSLNSTMESVSEVEGAADKLAEAAGLDEDERFRIGMAVREAAVNAVLHGNEYDPAKKISVSLENTGADLVISIADQGKGLDPDTLPDPLAPENLLRGTGRGIFLIRSFMDEVHFRQLNPGTELTLIKHLGTAGEKHSE
ncbi:MAG TPA: ATP-binding protein [Terracidiphilus sp.]